MAKGGIRFGAGRPQERDTIEDTLALDIRQFKRMGYLVPGRPWTSYWTRGGKTIADIGIVADEWELHLSFTAKGFPVQQRIRRDQTPCHFGGVRDWLLCPRCGQRQAVLYYSHRHFACRTCNNLAYRSQQLDVMDRSWRRQRKIEAKMGGENAYIKPKGMHEKTWQRLLGQRAECEDARMMALYWHVGVLMQRSSV